LPQNDFLPCLLASFSFIIIGSTTMKDIITAQTT
jgi:hypothetical protein